MSKSAKTALKNASPASTATNSPSVVSEYLKWLETSLSQHEALAKSLINHRGEKGRVVERVVETALRSILPGRFSIGTGFAINASGQRSSQLDIVIYDGHTNSPLMLDGGVGLFPIECIYGFVEVKSSLDSSAIDDCTKAIGTIRRLSKDKRYIGYGRQSLGAGKDVVAKIELDQYTLPPRAFVFAIKSSYANVTSFEKQLAESTTKNGAHIHGLAVLQREWFVAQRPYQSPHSFAIHEGQSLAQFCAHVLDSVQSMEMLPASIGRYLGLPG